MRINVHAGHNPAGKTACGAIGIVNESTENRKVANELIEILKKNNNIVYNCTVDNGKSVSDVINKIIAKANANAVDLDVSIHFNSGAKDLNGNNKTTGVEVLVYKNGNIAEHTAKRICERVSELGYKNRGVKVRKDLGYLKRTKAPAVLVECCFVDDKDDINLYNYKTMAKAIAEGILNKKISTAANLNITWYRVVCGSFSSKENALARKEELEKKGYPAFIEYFESKNMYRVITGSFNDRKLAEKRIEDLSKIGYISTFIDVIVK